MASPRERTKEEINKQAIISDRENFTADQLRAVGLRVVQEEAFFVDPKLQELENRQQVEVA